MLVVRVDDPVKDGAISAVTRVFDALWRRRLRRSSILDKIANTNNQHPCDQGRHLLSFNISFTAINLPAIGRSWKRGGLIGDKDTLAACRWHARSTRQGTAPRNSS